MNFFLNQESRNKEAEAISVKIYFEPKSQKYAG